MKLKQNFISNEGKEQELTLERVCKSLSLTGIPCNIKHSMQLDMESNSFKDLQNK